MFENIFRHDEKIFFARIFFCDQVCTSSKPQYHLEHARHDKGDSKRRQAKSSLFFPLYDIWSHILR